MSEAKEPVRVFSDEELDDIVADCAPSDDDWQEWCANVGRPVARAVLAAVPQVRRLTEAEKREIFREAQARDCGSDTHAEMVEDKFCEVNGLKARD